MAWTAPRTWSVGETVTAALVNTHIRDNENWLANDKPRCSAVRSTNQSIANASAVALSMTDADEYDTGPMHDPGSNPTRVTVPSGGGGVYRVTGLWSWSAAGANTRRTITWAKTGVTLSGYGDNRTADGGGISFGSYSFNIPLVAADYIEMFVYQESGGALNITGRVQLEWVAF